VIRRTVLIGVVAALLGMGLVQDGRNERASLEISTEPSEALLGQAADETVSLSLEPLAGLQQTGQPPAGHAQPEGQDRQQAQQQAQDGQQQTGAQDQQQVAGGGQAQASAQGEQIYSEMCAQCHGQQGEGGTGPALAGNQNLQDTQMVVNQIRQGGGGMPSFANQLSDEEIAAVATHEMNSWGNSFGEVTADQAAQAGGAQAGQQQAQQDTGGQQQQQGQQAAQAGQMGQATTVQITVPANGNAPVTLSLQLEIGGERAQAGTMQPTGQQGQVAGGGAAQEQAQPAQQPQQPAGQQGEQAQQEGAEQQQDGGQQEQQQDGAQQGQDDVRQGTLQIEWVQPAGATVTVTGPGGFSQEQQIVGGTVLEGLAPGTYTVSAALEGYESSSQQVEVTAQDTATVSLTLQQQTGQEQPEAGQAEAGQPAQGEAAQAEQQQADQRDQQQQQAAQQQQQEQVAGGGGQAQAGQQGAQVYAQQCAQCHGQQGGGGVGPALAGNQAMQDAQMVIGQILQGGGGMPAFANQLSDEEIAAVATHEMNSWGNSFGQVAPDQVAQQRGGGQQAGQQQQGGQQQAGQQEQAGQQQAGQQEQAGQQQAQAGLFTAMQARVGMQEYTQHCAVCHGGGLEGRSSFPPLRGEEFLSNWQGRTVGELFDYISKEMPQDQPGALGHLTYTDLTAYILSQNGFAAGDTALEPEAGRLAQVVIQGAAGGGGAQQEGETPEKVGEETQQQPEQEEQ
jgi:mono/diheme cytochrome c family protein